METFTMFTIYPLHLPQNTSLGTMFSQYGVLNIRIITLERDEQTPKHWALITKALGKSWAVLWGSPNAGCTGAVQRFSGTSDIDKKQLCYPHVIWGWHDMEFTNEVHVGSKPSTILIIKHHHINTCRWCNSHCVPSHNVTKTGNDRWLIQSDQF